MPLAVTGLIAATGVPAQATYYSGGMPSRTFNYKTHGINSTWVEFYDTGNIRWNQRVSSHIGRSTSAAADATAGSYSQSWYGQYSPHGVRGINRTFSIKVNSRTLQAAAGSNYTKWITSTVTHEIGHSLSLADNPNTTQASLMKHSRNRTTSQLPTAYDIAEVERIY
ncbi:hypothetical protein AB0J83_11865 [Actinoplanes sp. NPDC049596]|uniref:hypothetical protein n=1 Tax=unclassified Actinoplanes TaxID=2626549 RepID=UPI003426DF5C